MIWSLIAWIGSPSLAQAPEYRAQWVDAFHAGYLSAGQVSTMMQNHRAANSNVVIPEVRVYSDAYYTPNPTFYPALGAQATVYSHGVPLQMDLNSEPEPRKFTGFDPLAEMIRQARDTSDGKQPLEVWAWLVSFRTGAAFRDSHPTWLTRNSGGDVVTSDFDPGHPGVEQQLVNVCMDLAANYDVDGLNFDYIRFISSSNGYNPVSVARFNAWHGRTGTPDAADELWKQWRRDQVTNVVRKIYLNVIAVRPDIRLSADTITWASAPARPAANDPDPLATWKANFENTARAYNDVYQDWRSWMEEGIIDIAIPMAYFRDCTHPSDYARWMDFTKENQFGRQGMIGPGTYLNTLEDSIDQLKATRLPSTPGGKYATGQSLYSYASPYAETCGGTIVPDPAGMAAALSGGIAADPVPIYPTAVDLPPLPRWSNGKGHLMGTVTRQGAPSPGWVDGGIVSLYGPVQRTVRTDGTGFYGFVDLPPGQYTVSARGKNLQIASQTVTVTAANVAKSDFALVPGISPDRVSFTTSPGEAFSGQTFGRQPVVAVLGTDGKTMTDYSGPVTLSLKTGAGTPGAALIGTTTVSAVNGVATFTGLGIDRSGAGYVLVASSGDLYPGESAVFDVVRPPGLYDTYRRVAALPNGAGGATWEMSGLGVNRNPQSPYYGCVYLTDRATGQHKVRILRPDPVTAGTQAARYVDTGRVIQMDGTYLSPWDVSIGPDDAVWISDLGARRIYSAPPIPPGGQTSVDAVMQVLMADYAASGGPRGLTVTGPVQSARIHVAATSSSNAHVFTASLPSASQSGSVGLAWTKTLGFGTGPYGVAVDTAGVSYWPRSLGAGATESAFVKVSPTGASQAFSAALPAWATASSTTLQDAAFVPDPSAPGGGYLYYAARIIVNGANRVIVHRFGMDGAWLDGFGPTLPGAPDNYTPIDIPASTVSSVAYLDADDRGNVYVLGMDSGSNAVIKVARLVPYMLADARRAARLAAGLEAATQQDMARLDIADAAAGRIDMADAALLARKAAGLDANP